MLGRTGITRTRARRAAGTAALVAAVLALAGCGDGSGSEMVEAALDGQTPDSAIGADDKVDNTSPPTTGAAQHLADRSYEPGDCVTWEDDRSTLSDTFVVDCTEPHHVQITGEYLMPYSADYPTDAVWDALHTGECKTVTEQFLGFALDPHGRFSVQSLVPLPDAWAASDRTVWCAVGPWDDGGPQGLISDDVRMADQFYRYAAGECLSVPATGQPSVVPCDQPHHWEITGQTDLADLTAPPTDDQVFDRCSLPTEQYLGGPPEAPWLYGYELLAPESWAAGTRTVHCFVAQWDGAGNEIAVTGSARG